MPELTMFGLVIVHPSKAVLVSHIDRVELRGGGEQRLATGEAWYEYPNLTFAPLAQDDPLAGAFQDQIESEPTRIFHVEAPQFHSNHDVTGFPAPKTTESLSGLETSVRITFPANLSQAQVNGFDQRFFTFSGHKKLYKVKRGGLGVSAGGRSGTLRFVPNVQHQVSSGETLNLVNPKVMVGLAQGLPPDYGTDRRGHWRISLDLKEIWRE